MTETNLEDRSPKDFYFLINGNDIRVVFEVHRGHRSQYLVACARKYDVTIPEPISLFAKNVNANRTGDEAFTNAEFPFASDLTLMLPTNAAQFANVQRLLPNITSSFRALKQQTLFA